MIKRTLIVSLFTLLLVCCQGQKNAFACGCHAGPDGTFICENCDPIPCPKNADCAPPNIPSAPVPEPMTLTLLGTGLAGMLLKRKFN